MANDRPERYTNLIHARVPQDGSRTVKDYRYWYDDPRRYGLTQDRSGIGVPTPDEVTAGVTPSNYAYAPGNVLRYGADPSGATSSTSAFDQACRSNDYVWVPSGDYLFSTQLTISRGNITIAGVNSGQAVSGAPVTGQLGSTIRTGPGSFAAIRFDAVPAYCVRIKDLKILLKHPGDGQNGLSFFEVRECTIQRCWIEGIGDGVHSDDTYGIYLEGGGSPPNSFTGTVNIKECFIANHLNGVRLDGVCTSVNFSHNTFVGTLSNSPTSIAIRIANTCTETTMGFNEFDSWGIGVYSEGTNIRQIANVFDNNVGGLCWQWVRGSGNSEITAVSIGDIRALAATVFPTNNVDKCMVIGGATFYVDFAYIEAGGGFRERLRTVNLGEWTTPTFAAGNFAAGGAMTWTVSSGNVTNFQYALVGKTMQINWSIVSTTIGGTPSSTLTIAVPGGFTIAKDVRTRCIVLNNAVYTDAMVYALSGATILRIYKDPTTTTNYTAGATETHGQISFEVT